MPKVKKKTGDKRVNYVAKENTRLKGSVLLPSFYEEDRPRSSSFYDEDRPRSESGSFSSNPMVSITNMVRTPSPDVQLTDDDEKKDCPLQITPISKRSLSSRFSSHRSSFRNRMSPLYFSNERNRQFNNALVERVDGNSDKVEDILCETPKIKHDTLNASNLIVRKKDFLESKAHEKVSFNRTKSQNEVMHLQGIININPYLDYQHAQIKSNKEHVNELSFFTPDLLESMPASTPLHAVNDKGQIVQPLNDISNSSSMTNKTRNLRDSVLRRSAMTPVIIEEPFLKSSDVEDQVQLKRRLTKFLSNTAPPGELGATINIPKMTRAVNKLNHKSTSYKTLEESSNSQDDTLGAVHKVLRQVHRYGTITAKWTMSLFSVCMRLGFTVRPKITATPCTHSENLESIKTCTCNNYHQEIDHLKGKMIKLEASIDDLKKQLLENIQNNRKVEALNATLEELSKDIQNLKSLREEMDNLRNRFNNMSYSVVPPTPMSSNRVPGPVPPPPPPPPPPPLIPTQSKATGAIKKTTATSKARKDTPRPIISLDDILKVKLKKTSERTITTRRSTGSQPEVTKEMLQQVKLRKPLCRSMTTSRLPSISPEGSTSTSPHSSLRRLLKDDSSSFRVKRLRRVDGYSFNDINKKNKLSRERQ